MSNARITVIPYCQSAIQDLLGLEAMAKPQMWSSSNFAFGVPVTFEVSGAVWTRLRYQLNALAQRRIPAMSPAGVPLNTGKTQPALTYSMEWVPGDRPRVHQVEGVPLSLAAPANLTLRGTNLLAGVAASKIIQTWSPNFTFGYPGTRTYVPAVDALRLDAVAKGPSGNLIGFSIEPASGAGSVATTFNGDGQIYIKITPASGASNSTAIAAQVNGDPVASLFVTATALVASSPIAPTKSMIGGNGPSPGGLTPSQSGQIDRWYLEGGDGGGLAVLDVPVTAGSLVNRLRLTSNKAGNDQNLITLTLVMNGVAGVAVSGTNITVTRAGATETLANLVAAINGNVAAAALVTASAIGAGSLGAMPKTWLYGGGGEPPVATVGGAVASIVSQTDTAMVIGTTNGALVAAGVAAGEEANVQIQMNYGLVTASIGVVAA
jgi:hypothetical protein